MVKEHLERAVERVARVVPGKGARGSNGGYGNPGSDTHIDRSSGFDVFGDMRRIAFDPEPGYEDIDIGPEGRFEPESTAG